MTVKIYAIVPPIDLVSESKLAVLRFSRSEPKREDRTYHIQHFKELHVSIILRHFDKILHRCYRFLQKNKTLYDTIILWQLIIISASKIQYPSDNIQRIELISHSKFTLSSQHTYIFKVNNL